MTLDSMSSPKGELTGIKHLDDLHQMFSDLLESLTEMIRDMNAPLEDQAERRSLLTAIERLRDSALMHFRHEEELLSKQQCPALEAHRLDHDRFMAQTLELMGRLEGGAAMTAACVRDHLYDWFHAHKRVLERATGLDTGK